MNKVLVLLCINLTISAAQAQVTDGIAKAVSPGGAMPSMLHLTRHQAIEEALAQNPAIAAARKQVAESKTGSRLANAGPDWFI